MRSPFPPFFSRAARAVALLTMPLAHAACHDAPTTPAERATPRFAALQTDSGTPAPRYVARFLPPFGPPATPHQSGDATLTPTLDVNSATTTVAHFATDADSAPFRIVRDPRAQTFIAHWSTPRPTTATPLTLEVRLANATVGNTHVVLLPPESPIGATHGGGTPHIDFGRRHPPDSIPRIRWRPTLEIRFALLSPIPLHVTVEPGVFGSLQSGTRDAMPGERIQYRFTADSGYNNVLVMIDDDYAPNPGSVVMNAPHTLIVSADRVVTIPPTDAPLTRAMRDLLNARSPADAQRWLSQMLARTDTTNLADRLTTIATTLIDPARDAETLRHLDDALANHVYSLTRFTGTASGTPAPPTSGGGTAMSRMTPSSPRFAMLASLSTHLAEEPAIIAFVNGILNTPVQALVAATSLARLAETVTWRTPAPLETRLLYNRSVLADGRSPSATLARCFADLNDRDHTLGVNSLPIALARCSGRALHDVLHNMDDLREAAAQYINISLQRDAPERDARMIADSTTQWRTDGRNVLFVPHSQGNMMVQQAVQILRRNHLYAPSTDSTCIAAVSLAAPLSTNWPITSRHLTGIVVDGDVILSLGGNHFPHTETFRSDSAIADVRKWTAAGSPLIATIRRMMWGIRLHDVRASYLEDPNTSAVIRTALGQTLGSCTLGAIDVSPNPVNTVPNATQQLVTTLRDANGDSLDGTRRMTWTLQNNTGAVTFAPPNTIVAHYVGDGTSQTTTKTRATQTIIRVDPLPIETTVTTTRWAQFLRLPNSYNFGVSGSPFLPEWLHPGNDAWNGGACNILIPVVEGTASATYGQICFEEYTLVATPIQNAARYDVVIYDAGDHTPSSMMSSITPTLTLTRSSPSIAWNGLAPSPADRIEITAVDAHNHLLALGHTCVRGCAGWSSP